MCKVGFLLTLLLSCYSGQCIFYLQSSGCHFQIRQPAASWISGYLENFRAKITCISICAIYLLILFNISSHPIHEFLYAFHLQRRTKITRICFPVTDYLSNCILFYFLRLQILFHRFLITHGKTVIRFFRYLRKIDTPFIQSVLQICQYLCLIRSHLIHLIDEYERRYLISFEQSPKRTRVSLHPIGTIDHQDCIIQHL